MYESFGAQAVGHGVQFQLFMPDTSRDQGQYVRGGSAHIRKIQVRGDFQPQLGGSAWAQDLDLEMTEVGHPNGLLYRLVIDAPLADGYYQYKYFVEFENGTTRWVSDPCSKYGGGENENSAFVIGGNPVIVQPHPDRRPPRDLVIYELMIDNFTSEFREDRAPIDAVRDRLDYLQELGANAIEFMPWTAWPGNSFSLGYNPVSFFSVEDRYVRDDTAIPDRLVRLAELINDLHRRGMHVIMDGVFNHVDAGTGPDRGFPYRWLYQDPVDSPFIGKFQRDGFFQDLDFMNRCTQQFILDACTYWLDRFRIDGIRFDFSLGFYQKGSPDVGITGLVKDIRAHQAQKGETNTALFVEHLTDNRFDAIDDTNEICADGCWFDPFMFRHLDYARNGNIDQQLLRVLNANLDFTAAKGPVIYSQNHDSPSYIRAAGGRGRWFKDQPAAIALLTSPGAVLIHNGQEFGDVRGLDNLSPRPLPWRTDSSLARDFVGTRLFQIYKQLIAIRSAHAGLRSPNFFPYPFNHPDGYGVLPDQDVAIYHRWGTAEDGATERFIIVVNYSDFDQWVDIPFPLNGTWNDLLNADGSLVYGFKLYDQKIPSNWARIYHRRD